VVPLPLQRPFGLTGVSPAPAYFDRVTFSMSVQALAVPLVQKPSSASDALSQAVSHLSPPGMNMRIVEGGVSKPRCQPWRLLNARP
jgi:hypothetical protein